MTTTITNKLCFYSYYFGPNDQESNVIQKVPCESCDCYFFTNNIDTLNKLKDTKWKGRFVPVSCKNTVCDNSFDTKLLKSCPHLIDELNSYDYTVHMDSKQILVVSYETLLSLINEQPNAPMMMLPHRWWPKAQNAIIEEYYRTMAWSDKYFDQKNRILNYINDRIKNKKYSLNVNMHYETGFIVRKQKDPKVIELNECWYREIMECGSQCQISFFFTQQIVPNTVFPIVQPLHPLIVLHEDHLKRMVEKFETNDGHINWKIH